MITITLTNVVENLSLIEYLYFLCIYVDVSTFYILHNDIVALLGYKPSKQQEVMDKIQLFFGKLAHEAIADILRMHRTVVLADMWYIKHLSTQRLYYCYIINF